jgi:hypothetical protein
MQDSRRLVRTIRRTARALGLGLFLFWGAFLVEHLQWFLGGPGANPPLRVWALQTVHLLMLVGFIVAWKHELFGSILTISGALAFFVSAAGRNFFLFLPVTIAPALLSLFCWIRGRRGGGVMSAHHLESYGRSSP